MKRYFQIMIIALWAMLWCSCEDVETYAEMKEREKAYINEFIHEQGIQVIDMETFEENGFVTDTAKNQFVLFKDKGIYMQIVRKGEGRMMEDGDRVTFLVKYLECNIETDDTISGNLYAAPDKFICERNDDSFTVKYAEGYMSASNNGSIPSGWLVPFSYITPGRPNDKSAKVRLILPHSESTMKASQYVYPTYFEITYEPDPYF
ncbi:MAG: DUF4827 domain-containing protein [Bacteroidaceae bacterium]|nr:DUF4827 domain-containing protein [Bacteroidaceae bacterium]